MDKERLCNEYTSANYYGQPAFAEAVMGEMDRRKMLTSRNKQDMLDHTIRTGMPHWLGVCVWGPYSDVNRSGGAYGSFDQYVLVDGTYFYTRNGRVESWQQ